MKFDPYILMRQLWKSYDFTILKVAGLTIGFTVFIVLLYMVRTEMNYDEFWSNKEKLLRVGTEQYQEGELELQECKELSLGLTSVITGENSLK